MKPRRLLLAAFAGSLLALPAYADGDKNNSISIERPYARATAPGQPAGGAYLRVRNAGRADRLVAARTDVSAQAQLHEMKMEGDVMRMRQVDAIEVPPNTTVALQPGGLHIMLLGLKAPLKPGDRFPLTLSFERAGEMKVEVSVESVTAAEPMKHHMKR